MAIEKGFPIIWKNDYINSNHCVKPGILMTEDTAVPSTTIAIYGGVRTEVSQAVEDILGIDEKDFYQTRLSLGVLRRLGFLFKGGVESAGGVGEIVCMFAILVLTLAMFAVWQLGLFVLVIIVLAILSGGDAVKFLQCTYITASLDSIGSKKIERFVEGQAMMGHYVEVYGKGTDGVVASSSSAAYLFKRGIQFSLLVATSFVIVEIVYWLFNRHWLSGLDPIGRPGELPVLIVFALLFLAGIIVMDIGVILRFRLRRRLREQVRVVD
jgi:hypothetical protein